MSTDFGSVVWAPDEKEGFVRGSIVDIGATSIAVDCNGRNINANYNDVFPAEEDENKSVEDTCALMFLNEGTLLNNCRIRYNEKKIYSYVANILISINPYEAIADLYSTETARHYMGKSLGQLPPHIFAIADKAYREMRRHKQSQSIIVSGESGAGKTESQKAILRYLCENWGAEGGNIQQRILESNPILEAFGNAKTLRNNNSSRFGKFVEIHFGSDGRVAGGFISHYLLEKSRVCRQSNGERNYHVFYQLIAGSDDQLYKQLALAPPDQFEYLKNGNTCFFSHSTSNILGDDRLSAQCRENGVLRDEIVDDAVDFQRLCTALDKVGLEHEQIQSIWRTVAAVLHLGNVAFCENVGDMRGGCKVDPKSDKSLMIAAKLLGLEEDELRLSLETRIMQATKGGVKGTVIRVPLKTGEAAAARDALAKAIYSRLFDWLVASINRSIPFESSVHYIGVLDIAGFEFFATNSFEQFCINYCNEKLQHFFNERILDQEQKLYEHEQLHVPKIEYSDNTDCIDLFEKRQSGLLDLLDEEAKLPRGSPQHFTTAVHEANKNHFRLEAPRKSRLRVHREMRDDDGFMVRHYAGTVCYQTAEFLSKNNDQLHDSLEVLVEQSSVEFLRLLFKKSAIAEPGKRTGKLAASSVGSKFRAQLEVLLGKLRETGAHFVRCIKPNAQMKAGSFDGSAILSQLKCAGMTSVLRLMQQGYPSRTSFAELYEMYKKQMPAQLAQLDPRLFCKCLFQALGLYADDYKFGMTKVFFRPGKFAEFDQLLRQDPENMAELINKVRVWLNRTRWRKLQYGVLIVIKCKKNIEYRKQLITRLQSSVRGFIVRKRFAARLSLYRRANALLARSSEMIEVIDQLQGESRMKFASVAQECHDLLNQLIKSLRGFQLNNDIAAAEKQYGQCASLVDKIIEDIKNQATNDKKIAELERQRKVEEHRIAEENGKKARIEKERLERKKLEEEREKAEKEFLAAAEAKEAAAAKERELLKKRKETEERERLDAELASRLAQDDKQQVIELQPLAKPVSDSKGDLSSYKYDELRKIINTSKDPQEVAACKEEFHRRLRIYNEWKKKNSSAAKTKAEPPRAPQSVYNKDNALKTGAAPSAAVSDMTRQRYFKRPLVRPTAKTDDYEPSAKKARMMPVGMWYAHFSGQWIARQIVHYAGSKPQLLVAGRDDLNMYERSLDESGLAREKGAEMLGKDFETLWSFYSELKQ